jgi:predicted 3-demethylubiquinone-9 3-methyltransferase (glyoxalase superfamily)
MKIYPHLWFKSQAEEAMEFYTSVFKDSKVLGRVMQAMYKMKKIIIPDLERAFRG